MKLVAGHWGDTPHRVWRPRAAARRKRSDRRAGPGPAAGPLLCQTRVIRPWAARQGVLSMHRHITRALYAAVAAITLGTLGFSGAGSPARGLAVHQPARVQPVLGWLLGRRGTLVPVHLHHGDRAPRHRRLGGGHRALSWPAGRGSPSRN